MTTLTEGRHPAEFLLSEANFHRSRDTALLIASQTIVPGMIIDRQPVIPETEATASVGESNTGNATIAMDNTTPTNVAVKEGRYVGVATAATTVAWTAPDGTSIGNSTHGQNFTDGGLKFKITAGGTATTEGDEFYIDVVINAYEHLKRANDSVLTVAGIALYPAVTGAAETGKVAMIARDAEINGPGIVWGTGITAAQKIAASKGLAALGIIIRS